MTDRAWVRRDPARCERLLDLLRAKPRSTLTQLKCKMALSRACVYNMLCDAQRDGIVDAELDAGAIASPRSPVPFVYWLKTAETPRWPRSTASIESRASAPGVQALRHYPYVPTGTPAHRAGAIQVLCTWGMAHE